MRSDTQTRPLSCRATQTMDDTCAPEAEALSSTSETAAATSSAATALPRHPQPLPRATVYSSIGEVMLVESLRGVV